MTPVPLTRLGLVCTIAFGAFLALDVVAVLTGSRWWLPATVAALGTGWLARIDVREAREASAHGSRP